MCFKNFPHPRMKLVKTKVENTVNSRTAQFFLFKNLPFTSKYQSWIWSFFVVFFCFCICYFCIQPYLRDVSELFVLLKGLVKHCPSWPFHNFPWPKIAPPFLINYPFHLKSRLVLTQSLLSFPPSDTHPRCIKIAMGSVSFPILTLRLRCRWEKSAPINIDISLLLSTSIGRSGRCFHAFFMVFLLI